MQKISKRTKYISSLFSRCLLAIIVVLVSVIFINLSDDCLLLYKNYVLEKSFSFAKINNLYQKYLGSILPSDNVEANTQSVFNQTFTYLSAEEFIDGTKFMVSTNYLMPCLHSGIVVFIGQKDNYGDTIIIQGTDGVDIWYTNIETSLTLYDYVEKDTLVGQSNSDNITLVLQKDNEYIDYYEYEENNQS